MTVQNKKSEIQFPYKMYVKHASHSNMCMKYCAKKVARWGNNNRAYCNGISSTKLTIYR